MRPPRPKPVHWLVVALLLLLVVPPNSAHAQFASATDTARAGSSPQAPVRSLSPTPPTETSSRTGSPLNPYRSLEKYVEPTTASPLSQSAPVGPSLQGTDLNRREELLWGSVGLVVSSFCDTDPNTHITRPSPLLNSSERTCVECDRMTRRAIDAVAAGLFSPNP